MSLYADKALLINSTYKILAAVQVKENTTVKNPTLRNFSFIAGIQQKSTTNYQVLKCKILYILDPENSDREKYIYMPAILKHLISCKLERMHNVPWI